MRSEARSRTGPLLGLIALLAAPAGAERVLLERILAVVDGHPLLMTEVALVESVRGCSRADAVKLAIDERLMFREASRLPQTAVGPDDEEAAYASLLERAGLAEGGGVETELRVMARREVAILKYVAFRFRPQVRISDEAVRRAYDEAYAGREPPPPLAEVEAELRARLFERELDTRLEAWIKELRQGAEIRLNP